MHCEYGETAWQAKGKKQVLSASQGQNNKSLYKISIFKPTV